MMRDFIILVNQVAYFLQEDPLQNLNYTNLHQGLGKY